MLFSSITFLFTFLPVTLFIYYLVPWKLKNLVLLISSLIFYAWVETVYIFLMIFSILFNYVSGLDIARNLKERSKAKKSLIFNVTINLMILGFFKYYGFLIDSLNAVLPFHIPYTELALPIGISFYTFQTLSYIIDVYRGTVKVQTNLLDFGVYVTMFPQLIAGPIVKYKDINDQLKKRQISLTKFGDGTVYFIRGLAKKILLANVAGMVYTKITGLPSTEVSVLTAWVGIAAYTFQIYFDFGGYSDMAIGLGKMFGFEFMKNFDYPYISSSITEFWRRWHISLSTWFKEYVYIPLGGNRVNTTRHIRNILIVWFLTGLWHGAAWNFVAWGMYYGILLLVEKYFLVNVLERIPGFLRHVYTMVLVMIGWVFFAGNNMAEAVRYLGLMFGVGGHGIIDRQAIYFILSDWMMWLIAILASAPGLYRIFERFLHQLGKKAAVLVNTVAYGILFLICIAFLVTETYNPFLYFRF